MQFYTNYLMILSPPDFVKKEIGRYKRASVNVIGGFDGMHSIAHITIINQNRCKPYLVQPAIARMEQKLVTMPPIELRINGFNFFNHGKTGKTIYAVIESTTQTDIWFKLLKQQMNIKTKNFVPHITIVKNIPVDDFEELWPHFENRPFTATFKVQSLTILHRETYSAYPQWRVYRELFFGNRILAF
jgi:2'-5' RNA ligase